MHKLLLELNVHFPYQSSVNLLLGEYKVSFISRLVDFLLEGDEQSSWNLVEIYKNGELLLDSHLFYTAITDAMYEVGKLWEKNYITVAQEHIASNVCVLLLNKYSLLSDKIYKEEEKGLQKKNKALFLCIEGEEHSIGCRIVSNIFREHGWNTRYIGANVPFQECVSYAMSWRPKVIGLSASILYNIPNLVKTIETLSKLEDKPDIIVGGRLTTLFDIKSYCEEEFVVIRNLIELNEWLLSYKNCKNIYVFN